MNIFDVANSVDCNKSNKNKVAPKTFNFHNNEYLLSEYMKTYWLVVVHSCNEASYDKNTIWVVTIHIMKFSKLHCVYIDGFFTFKLCLGNKA